MIDTKTVHPMRRAVAGDTKCADCGATRGTVAADQGAGDQVDQGATVAPAGTPVTADTVHVAPPADMPAVTLPDTVAKIIDMYAVWDTRSLVRDAASFARTAVADAATGDASEWLISAREASRRAVAASHRADVPAGFRAASLVTLAPLPDDAPAPAALCDQVGAGYVARAPLSPVCRLCDRPESDHAPAVVDQVDAAPADQVAAPAGDQVDTVPAPAPAAPRTRKPRTAPATRTVPAQTTKDADMSTSPALSPAVARLVAKLRPARPAGATGGTVRPADMIHALKFATTAVPRRPSVPVMAMTSIRVDAAAGTVTLATSDFDRFHVATVDLVDGAPAVSGHLVASTAVLKDWLAGQTLPTVDFWDTGRFLVIAAGAGTLTLPTGPAEDYPTVPDAPATIGTVSAVDLVDAVKRADVTAGTDRVTPQLCAAMITTHGDTLRVDSTDRFRASATDVGWSPAVAGASHRVHVPVSDLVDAVKLMTGQGDTLTLGATADPYGWASVTAGRYVAIIRRTSSMFDESTVRKIADRPAGATLTVPAGALVDAVKLVTAGQEPCDRDEKGAYMLRGAELSATAGTLTVRFRDQVTTVDGVTVTGADDAAMIIDPKYVGPMVAATVGSVKGKAGKAKMITIELGTSAGAPAVATSADAPHYRHVVKPMDEVTSKPRETAAPAAKPAAKPAAPAPAARPSHPFTSVAASDKRCTVDGCGKTRRAGIHFGTPVVTGDAAPADTVDQVDAVTVDQVDAAPAPADTVATVDQVDQGATVTADVPAAPAPRVDTVPVAATVDQVDGEPIDAATLATVREAIAGATWSHGSGYVGKGAARRKFTGPVCTPAGRVDRAAWRALVAQLNACGAGAYMRGTGFACESGDAGNPWSGRTWSTRERVAAWLAATAGDQVDQGATVTADVPADVATVDQVDAAPAPADTVATVDQVDAVTADTDDAASDPRAWRIVHAYVKASNATGCALPAHPLPTGHGMLVAPADIYGAYTQPSSGCFIDLVTCTDCAGTLIAASLAPYADEIAGCACTRCTGFATAVGTGDMLAIVATARVLTLSLRRGQHMRPAAPVATVDQVDTVATVADDAATVDQVDAVTDDAAPADVTHVECDGVTVAVTSRVDLVADDAAPADTDDAATVDQVDAAPAPAPADTVAPVRVTLVAVDTVDVPAPADTVDAATVDQVDAVTDDAAPADLVATLSAPATVTVSGAGDFAGRTVTLNGPARPVAKAVRSALGTHRAAVGGSFSVVAPSGSRVMGIAFTSDSGAPDWSAVIDLVAGIVADYRSEIVPVAVPASA